MNNEVEKLDLDSLVEKEYEVECYSGKYRLKPSKIWVLPTQLKYNYYILNVIALFRCPDGSIVKKRIAVLKMSGGLVFKVLTDLKKWFKKI